MDIAANLWIRIQKTHLYLPNRTEKQAENLIAMSLSWLPSVSLALLLRKMQLWDQRKCPKAQNLHMYAQSQSTGNLRITPNSFFVHTVQYWSRLPSSFPPHYELESFVRHLRMRLTICTAQAWCLRWIFVKEKKTPHVPSGEEQLRRLLLLLLLPSWPFSSLFLWSEAACWRQMAGRLWSYYSLIDVCAR